MDHQAIETDVVVVGYGSAGAAAAITAHDHGARVIILEKMPSGGGNSRLSAAMLISMTGPGAVQHVDALCFGKTSKEVIEAYVDGCMKIKDWIKEMGGETVIYQNPVVTYPTSGFPCWPNVPGWEHTELLRVAGGTADELPAMPLWRLLTQNVERRGIKLMTNTPAKELTRSHKGEVTGVVAEREGQEISIQAKKAVILTCGSFEYNEAMKDTFLPLTPIYAIGNPGNTGDGVLMAQKVGAALWHMNAFHGWFVFKTPEYKAAFTIRSHTPGFIYVDKDGRRFGNETGSEIHEVSKLIMSYAPHRHNYPHLPAYAIFDDLTRRKGPLSGIVSGANDYKWSLDSSKEITKGWIRQGKTIGDLARRISVDEATLTNTVARYNEYCKAGKDAEFGRSRETLEPIQAPPYCAIEISPGMGTAAGGPRRDREARVVNSQGKPIPRLYAAGGLGSIWGFLTLSGGGLTDAIVFGRIAGRNAAEEEPWM
jgi:succinate dehydrogenase/fumarate reductase flavoprotein subunit